MDNAQLAAKFSDLEAKFHKLQIKFNELKHQIHFQGGLGTMGGTALNATSGGLGAQRQFQRLDTLLLGEYILASTSETETKHPPVAQTCEATFSLNLQQQNAPDNDPSNNAQSNGPPNKGPKGDKGDKGDTGATGATGAAGEDSDSDARLSCFVLDVPHDSGRSYLSMGEPGLAPPREEAQTDASSAYGIYSYTIGQRNEITKENDNSWHYGISSDYYDAAQFSAFNDNAFNYFIGTSFDYKFGLMGDVTSGLKTSIDCAISTEFNLAAKFNFGCAFQYDMVAGPSHEACEDMTKEADHRISLKTDPEDKGLDWFMESVMPPAAAIIAGGTALTGFINSVDEGTPMGDSCNDMMVGTSAVVHALGAISAALATTHYMRNVKDNSELGASYLEMDPNEVKLGAHGISGKKPIKKGKIKYTKTDKKIVTISAKQTAEDTSPVEIAMTRDGGSASDETGTIELKAGKSGNDKSHIKLVVGKSSIIIKDDSIVFKVGSTIFTMNEAKGLEITGNGKDAGFIVESGTIKSKGGTISGKLETKDLDAKVMKLKQKADVG